VSDRNVTDKKVSDKRGDREVTDKKVVKKVDM